MGVDKKNISKPLVQTTRYVDLLAALKYLNNPSTRWQILPGNYNNNSFNYIACFDGRDAGCEEPNPEDYEYKYIDACNHLWSLYPDESSSLMWEVSW